MKLKWTRFALQDLKYLHDYIAEDNPSAAKRMVSRIKDAANNLRQHSHIGRVGRVPDSRELIIAGTPYIVVYYIEKGCIYIVSVIHTAMRWPESFP